MKHQLFTKKSHFSIRKLSLGVCSVIIGTSLFGQVTVEATEVATTGNSTALEVELSGEGVQGEADEQTPPSLTDASGLEGTPSAPSASQNSELSASPAPAILPSPKTEGNLSSPVVTDQNTYTLTYERPAAATYQGWESEALPIGNGEMGAKIFGFVGGERIQFNEKTLWSGGPTPEATNYNGGNLQDKHAVLPEIREALERGDTATAKRLAERHLVGPNSEEYGRYLAFGDVLIDFTNQDKTLESVTDYRRDLDITTAVTTTSYTQDGTTFNREHFISFPDDVSVTRLTKSGDKDLEFDISMRLTDDLREGNNTYSSRKSTYKTADISYDDKGILLSGTVTNNKLTFASYLGIDTDGTIERHEDKLSVRGASYANLLMNAKTDFAQDPKTNYRRPGAKVVDEVKATVAAAKTKTYDQIKADHVADYKSLFDRVKINLTDQETATPTDQLLRNYRPENGQQLEEMFFQYGRYLMITSSRDKANALPANLQGVWNAVDNPPWNSDYHLNVNLQMNYWPVYSANIAETAIPLINYIDDMRHYGRIAAEEYGNIVSRDGEENGWLAHTQATPFGWTTPGWSYYWGWSPASNAWIMQNVYDYYKFTQDKDYLESKIYPMLKETAKFWNSFLHYDQASDRYVSSPSYSPEHGTITIGNTFDQSLVWQLFHDYMEAAEILGKDADFVAEVKNKYDKLKPLHINKAGRIKEWYEEDTPAFTGEGVELHHRHVSELVGLFPGTLFSKDTPEYLEAARATLNHRGDGGTGWSKANKVNLWARLLDGNRAHRLLAEQLRGSTLTNLWDTHTPFQIDGNFGATSGMTEMLLQSHTGYIAPLPALPDAWKTGQVSGLVARGNVEIDMAWQEKNLTSMKMVAKSGGTLQIDYPKIETANLTINGKPASFRKVQDDRIEVVTQPGDVILLGDILGRITDLRAERTGESLSQLTFSPIAGADYYRIERVGRDATGQVVETRTFSTDQASYTDRTILPSRSYDYRVTAVLGEISTADSDPASIAEIKQIMDDRDSSITYGSLFGNWADAALHAGTEKYGDLTGRNVSEADATVTVPFVGTGIQIYGLKHSGLGKAFVTIDGQDRGEIDFYKTGATEKGVLIGEFTGLADGPHVMTLRINPAAPTRGERNKISLDYFRVLSSRPSETEVLDDRDPRVTYGSAYGNWADGSLYGGTEKFIDVTGSERSEADRTATLTFEGTGIQIYGLKHSGLGKATVTIDGQPVDPLIFNKSGSVDKGVLVGEYRGLTDGRHTIAITVAPEAVNGSRHKISLDKFVILKAPIVIEQSYPAGLTDVAAADNKLVVTLPEGDWTKVEISLPEQAQPVVLTKSGDQVTVTNGSRAEGAADGQLNLTLPAGQKAGVVRAVTYQGTEVSGQALAYLSRTSEVAQPLTPEKRERKVTVAIPFTTTTREDNTKDPGYRHVETPGVKGSEVEVYEDTYEGDVLKQAGTVVVRRESRVEPVTEVVVIGTRKTEKRERKVPVVLAFETESTNDPNLPLNETVVDQEGQNGSVVKVYEDTYVNGVRTAEGTVVIREENRQEPRNRKVRVGTRAVVVTPTVTTRTDRVLEEIPFDTISYEDSSLELGKEEVVQDGTKGSQVKVYAETLTDGQVTSRRLVDIEDVVAPVARVVRRGSRPVSTVTTNQREVLEILDFITETLQDSNLDVGTEVVVREGVAGRVTKVYEDTFTNGVKTGERLVSEKDHRVPINKVVLVGIRPVATRTTNRREVLEDLTFETKYVDDDKLDLGTALVVQEGHNGSLIKVYEDTFVNGVKTGEHLVEVKEVVAAVTKIVRVGTRPTTTVTIQTREEPEELPFETQRIEDDTLELGKEEVVQEGKAGLLVKVYEDTLTNGIKVGERLVAIREAVLPVTEVIRVGTKLLEVDQPTNPANPVETEQPTNPANPVETEQPTNPANPVETEQPTNPAKPVETEQPTNPAKPVETEQPTNPVKPVEPGQPTESSQSVETDQLTDSTASDRVLTDAATGVSVRLAAGETAEIVALRIVHKETRDVATPAILLGKDYDLFDIELVDKDGFIIKTKYAAEVTLPVDAGKEVLEVIYLPNETASTSLPFRTTVLSDGNTAVVFNAPHFSEYGIVYKSHSVDQTPASTQPVRSEVDAVKTEPAVKSVVTPAPVGAAASAVSTESNQAKLPETGDASSAISVIGAASLMASLGLVSFKKKD